MADGFSLIKINDLSKPATVLIEKISDAVGGYFKPFQIRRVAKAEAEAEIIKEQAQIEITDLHRRALIRFVTEEAKKQNNIESITEKAIPQLNDSSNPQGMEDDYSKRTVNSLGSLDKGDAQLFTKLCSFVCSIDIPTPLIFDENASIYNDQQINFSTLTHLDDIGLISFNTVSGIKRVGFQKETYISYYDTTLKAEFTNPDNNELGVGKVIFTNIGEELARICSSESIDGFLNYAIDKWNTKGIVVTLLDPSI